MTMDIKKFWTLLAIALTGLFALSCGGDDDDTPDNGNNQNREVAVLVQASEITDCSAVLTGTVCLDLITIKYSSISYGVELSTDADFRLPIRVLARSRLKRLIDDHIVECIGAADNAPSGKRKKYRKTGRGML